VFTDVSAQHIGPILKDQAVQEVRGENLCMQLYRESDASGTRRRLEGRER